MEKKANIYQSTRRHIAKEIGGQVVWLMRRKVNW